ncbi:hypothetical protein NBRC3278_0165 [Acetobacter pasteurianus NBRC 3278]|uniref:STAND NTPase 4 small alpha/beta domain-containing protein n=2 Tax=Acetobacter pasteurianus TaxID=438 RepID=A0A401WZQ9_ACEPA|nr:hypothetical protein NBRC3277_0177 [Acetobacter pasteurianus NBRC 3277]GCD61072.1 hypothetical protein NBRC3278_0165 [Acetobacter pasteurianus NBRC 3278]
MNNAHAKNVKLTDILTKKNDIIFLGGRESGKTSLAHKIAISCTDGICDEVRVPAIIDMRDTALTFHLKKAILTYYNIIDDRIETQSIQRCIRENFNSIKFLVILDNFDEHNKKHISALAKMSNDRKNIRFIVFSSLNISINSVNNKASKLKDLFFEPVIYNIQDFPTKYIRDLSNKKLSFSGEHNPQLVEKIVNQFRENDLPRNGYIVSLLLWSWEKNGKKENINEALLIESLIDYLLNVADFTQAIRGTFDSKLKSLLLQEIASKMFSGGDYEDSVALQRFLKDFLDGKGLEFDSIDVLDTLCRSGILKRSNDRVSFKYRCFQEYFNALYLMQNSSRILKATEHNNILSHSREIEFMTSLSRLSLGISERLQKDLQFTLNHLIPNKSSENSLKSMNFDSTRMHLFEPKTEKLRNINITQDMVDDINDSVDRKYREKEKEKNERKKTASLSIRENHDDKVSEVSEVSDNNDKNYDIISVNTLLARIIKFSEFEDIDIKIKSIILSIKNTVLISIFFVDEIAKRKWENEDIVKKLIKKTHVEFETVVSDIKNLSKLVAPLMFVNILREELPGPSTFIALEKILDDTNHDFEVRLIAGIYLIFNFKRESLHKLKKLLLNVDNIYYKLFVIECMSLAWTTSVIPEPIKNDYLNVIADLERNSQNRRGISGKLQKGALIENIKKRRFKEE